MIAFASVFDRVFDTRALGALAVSLLLLGCTGSGRQVTNPENEQWFCQSNEIGDGWDCVQDDNLAQVPVPTRMPPEPEPPAPLEIDPLPVADGAADDIADLSADPREELARMQAEAAAANQADAQPVPAAEGGEAAALESAPAPAPAAAEAPPPPTATPSLGADTEARPMAERPRAPPPKPTATSTTAPEDASIPKHVRLAYVPAEPTPILDLPPEYYAVQMLAMSSKELIEEYVTEHQLRGMSAARVENNGELYYVLVLGIYTTLERAQDAATDLPSPLDSSEPWIRPLGSLQAAMRRADDLAGSARF